MRSSKKITIDQIRGKPTSLVQRYRKNSEIWAYWWTSKFKTDVFSQLRWNDIIFSIISKFQIWKLHLPILICYTYILICLFPGSPFILISPIFLRPLVIISSFNSKATVTICVVLNGFYILRTYFCEPKLISKNIILNNIMYIFINSYLIESNWTGTIRYYRFRFIKNNLIDYNYLSSD